MSKVRVPKNTDGSISIIYPASKSRHSEESEEVWLDRVFVKAMPTGAVYRDMDISELPSDRETRGAWELDEVTGRVRVNPEKAKKIKEK